VVLFYFSLLLLVSQLCSWSTSTYSSWFVVAGTETTVCPCTLQSDHITRVEMPINVTSVFGRIGKSGRGENIICLGQVMDE